MSARIVLTGLLAVVCLGQALYAQQSLNVALFDRYVSALREQLAIPGLSGAIVQGGRVVWSAGFGDADMAGNSPARDDTPYPILGLSQVLSSTLLLRECVDFGHLELSDEIERWVPGHVDEALTIEAVLSHTATGSYRYEPARFAVVADVMAQCGGNYSSSLADEILSRFAMIDSVPGGDVLDSSQRDQFSSGQLDRYESAFQRLAAPYRIDDRGRATRSAYVTPPTNPATSVVASVLDLAKFDLALRDGLLLSQDTLRLAWLPVAGGPAGLGWLIQRVGSDTVVWQYGVETDAYSSLMIKVPGRDLTLILLANSDRLAAPHATAVPDVTASVFAKLFFRTFLV